MIQMLTGSMLLFFFVVSDSFSSIHDDDEIMEIQMRKRQIIDALQVHAPEDLKVDMDEISEIEIDDAEDDDDIDNLEEAINVEEPDFDVVPEGVPDMDELDFMPYDYGFADRPLLNTRGSGISDGRLNHENSDPDFEPDNFWDSGTNPYDRGYQSNGLRRRDSVMETAPEYDNHFNSFTGYHLDDSISEQSLGPIQDESDNAIIIHEVVPQKKIKFGAFGYFTPKISVSPIPLYSIDSIDVSKLIIELRQRRRYKWRRPWSNEINGFNVRSTSYIFFESDDFATSRAFESEFWFDWLFMEIGNTSGNFSAGIGMDDHDADNVDGNKYFNDLMDWGGRECELLVETIEDYTDEMRFEFMEDLVNYEQPHISQFLETGDEYYIAGIPAESSEPLQDEIDGEMDGLYDEGEITDGDITWFTHLIHEQPLLLRWKSLATWSLDSSIAKKNISTIRKNEDYVKFFKKKSLLNRRELKRRNAILGLDNKPEDTFNIMPWDSLDRVNYQNNASSMLPISDSNFSEQFPILLTVPFSWSSKVPDLMPIFIDRPKIKDFTRYAFPSRLSDSAIFKRGLSMAKFRMLAVSRRRRRNRIRYFRKLRRTVLSMIAVRYAKKPKLIAKLQRRYKVYRRRIHKRLLFWRCLSLTYHRRGYQNWLVNFRSRRLPLRRNSVIHHGRRYGRRRYRRFSAFFPFGESKYKSRFSFSDKTFVDSRVMPYATNSIAFERYNYDSNLAYGYDEYAGSIVSSMYDITTLNTKSTISASPVGWSVQRLQVLWPQTLYGVRPRSDGLEEFFALNAEYFFELAGYKIFDEMNVSTIHGGEKETLFNFSPAFRFKDSNLLKIADLLGDDETDNWITNDFGRDTGIVEFERHSFEPIAYSRSQTFKVGRNHVIPKALDFNTLAHHFIEMPIRHIESVGFPVSKDENFDSDIPLPQRKRGYKKLWRFFLQFAQSSSNYEPYLFKEFYEIVFTAKVRRRALSFLFGPSMRHNNVRELAYEHNLNQGGIQLGDFGPYLKRFFRSGFLTNARYDHEDYYWEFSDTPKFAQSKPEWLAWTEHRYSSRPRFMRHRRYQFMPRLHYRDKDTVFWNDLAMSQGLHAYDDSEPILEISRPIKKSDHDE